jgi:hypothetical protein
MNSFVLLPRSGPQPLGERDKGVRSLHGDSVHAVYGDSGGGIRGGWRPGRSGGRAPVRDYCFTNVLPTCVHTGRERERK